MNSEAWNFFWQGYVILGAAWAANCIGGFMVHLHKNPKWRDDIPFTVPVGLFSAVAAVILVSAFFTITITWPFWMIKRLLKRD